MTIDVLSLKISHQISRVYPVAVAAYVMAFAREARSNRERNKRVTRLLIFPSGKVGKVGKNNEQYINEYVPRCRKCTET